MDTDTIVDIIREAFREVLCPRNLSRSNPYGVDLEIVRGFEGKTWEDISCDINFLCGQTDFAFLTTRAFHYFLPAYMIGAIIYPKEAGKHFVHSVLFKICPPQWHDEGWECLRNLQELVTPDQKRAIVTWLEYLVQAVNEKPGYLNWPDGSQLRTALELWRGTISSITPLSIDKP